MKTLKEIIDMYDKAGEGLEINYRTYYNNLDILDGSCHFDYQTGELISNDGDWYCLNDGFNKWEMYTDTFSGEQYLVVWYESEWIS